MKGAMTSREVVAKTLRFETPGRIPRSLWILPSAYLAHGRQLVELLERYPLDINPRPPVVPELPPSYRAGTYRDEWGSVWLNLQDGIAGEVKEPALSDWSALSGFKAPPVWTADDTSFVTERHRRAPDAFTHIVAGSFFERMQYLRGTEQLYMDLMDQSRELLRLRDIIMDYLQRRVEKCLEDPCDAIHFADDWGSQLSLLISPKLWREFFKPCYARLFEQVRRGGKFVFMHSDGFIMDIIEDLVEVGVNALNCQVWAMGPDKVGARFRGKITFWGELNRQTTVPHGTPEDIRAAIRVMKENLATPSGGLIAQSEIDNLTPLANIEAILRQW